MMFVAEDVKPEITVTGVIRRMLVADPRAGGHHSAERDGDPQTLPVHQHGVQTRGRQRMAALHRQLKRQLPGATKHDVRQWLRTHRSDQQQLKAAEAAPPVRVLHTKADKQQAAVERALAARSRALAIAEEAAERERRRRCEEEKARIAMAVCRGLQIVHPDGRIEHRPLPCS